MKEFSTWKVSSQVGLFALLFVGAMSADAQFEALERVVMPGPLIQAHSEHESQCSSCHARFARTRQAELCLDCHVDIAEDLATGTGFHSLSPEVSPEAACAQCHTEHAGRDADIVGLVPESFDHSLTDFPLHDSHREAVCDDCHDAAQPFHEVAGTQCNDCHASDDRHMGNLGTACADCHRETTWADATYDHSASSGFALTGSHGALDCVSCHVAETYVDTPTDCYGCHAQDDAHMGNNGRECRDCHQSTQWTDSLFDHLERTGFALTGGHAGVDCDSCHSGNKFEVAQSTQCHDCHSSDDAHDGINGTECAQCHRTSAWTEVLFDHARDAEFPLRDAHAAIECAGCHIDPVSVALPAAECIGCHADDDPHQLQLGENCASCHGEAEWLRDVRFDHDFSVFPLLGRHAEIDCENCHASPAFRDAEEDCIDCHLDDDAHEMRLGAECATCHVPLDWALWNFDHDSGTEFPLDGAHERLTCEGCHRTPRPDGAIGVSQACASCHRGDDIHRGEFGIDCAQCHTTRSFADLRTPR